MACCRGSASLPDASGGVWTAAPSAFGKGAAVHTPPLASLPAAALPLSAALYHARAGPAPPPPPLAALTPAAQALGRDCSVPPVVEVDAAVEPLLDLDFGPGQARAACRRQQLVRLPLETDRVIVRHHARELGRQHGLEVDPGRQRTPGRLGVGRVVTEAAAVTWDEDAVEVLRGPPRRGDLVEFQLGDQPVLEGAVEAFAASAGLGAVGEDQADLEQAHGVLEVCRLALGVVQRLGAAVAGGDELAGAVEVEGAGQAEADEDLVTDLEAAVAVFLGLELAPQRLAGGVVAGQQQAAVRMAGAEPGVRTAVEEQQLSGPRAAGAAAAVLVAAAGRPGVASEPQ